MRSKRLPAGACLAAREAGRHRQIQDQGKIRAELAEDGAVQPVDQRQPERARYALIDPGRIA